MSDSPASILYPSAAPSPVVAPAAAPAPAHAALAAVEPPAAPAPAQAAAEADAPVRTSLADKLPDDMPKSYDTTRWVGEPAATSTIDYNNFVLSEDSEGQHVADPAMHAQALDAMQSVGLGVTQARYFYELARETALSPSTIDRATAEAQLRETWGSKKFDANLAAVQALVTQAQASWPGVRDWLRTSGNGNNPRFLIAAARIANRK